MPKHNKGSDSKENSNQNEQRREEITRDIIQLKKDIFNSAVAFEKTQKALEALKKRLIKIDSNAERERIAQEISSTKKLAEGYLSFMGTSIKAMRTLEACLPVGVVLHKMFDPFLEIRSFNIQDRIRESYLSYTIWPINLECQPMSGSIASCQHNPLKAKLLNALQNIQETLCVAKDPATRNQLHQAYAALTLAIDNNNNNNNNNNNDDLLNNNSNEDLLNNNNNADLPNNNNDDLLNNNNNADLSNNDNNDADRDDWDLLEGDNNAALSHDTNMLPNNNVINNDNNNTNAEEEESSLEIETHPVPAPAPTFEPGHDASYSTLFFTS